MAVGEGNRITLSASSFKCYKTPGLVDTILNSTNTSTLDDRYSLGKQLGWGQFGVIRICSDKMTGEILACKSIAKDRLVTPDDICSVKLEIDIMTRLSGHPNVVDLKAVYEEDNFVHLVMELCAGGELFHRLEKHGRIPESQARILFKQLMEVVMYCHDSGVVHRDLKPENILLATNSSSSPIKLADFGLATYIKPGQSLHGTVGSPFYIAPEVLSGGYNQAADVWSAGVILYILLSGIPPFWGKTKSRIFDAVRAADLRFPSDPWDQVSVSAKDLITGMLCTDPAQRLTSSQVLDHSWIKDSDHQSKEAYDCSSLKSMPFDMGGGSFSNIAVTANRDFSFSSESLLPCDGNADLSPLFNCKSSFSSFLNNVNPCASGFSFHNSCELTSPGLSPPISSMPSFSFLGPVMEQTGSSASPPLTADITLAGTSSCNLFISYVCHGCKTREKEERMGITRRGGTTSFRGLLGIHSRRNRTIGLGEFDQLDLTTTESVIRWASCTHLPTASSLRSSLVC